MVGRPQQSARLCAPDRWDEPERPEWAAVGRIESRLVKRSTKLAHELRFDVGFWHGHRQSAAGQLGRCQSRALEARRVIVVQCKWAGVRQVVLPTTDDDRTQQRVAADHPFERGEKLRLSRRRATQHGAAHVRSGEGP
eukprot:scaffold388_cov111-Isochrysis_galbana.AAC.3